MRDSNWTIPNLLTVSRILLTPGFVMAYVQQRFDLAWLLFAVAGLTDALDGILARLLHQRSRLGSMLDPLADKVLLDTSFICLTMQNWLPKWLTILVVSRDAIIVGGLVLMQVFGVEVKNRICPTWLGKGTTVCQIALVLFVMAEQSLGVAYPVSRMILIGLTALVTLWSEVDYVLIGFSLIPLGENGNGTGNGAAG
ncbi:MAG: CDP-alcohol phosphatidyltransferase family protein [Desulfovibrionaceae bacterium]